MALFSLLVFQSQILLMIHFALSLRFLLYQSHFFNCFLAQLSLLRYFRFPNRFTCLYINADSLKLSFYLLICGLVFLSEVNSFMIRLFCLFDLLSKFAILLEELPRYFFKPRFLSFELKSLQQFIFRNNLVWKMKI